MAWGKGCKTSITEKGQHTYLSGGATRQGVGICISANFVSQILFFLFMHSPKGFAVCFFSLFFLLFFSMASRRFRVFNVYFPTAWHADGAVEQMHDVLNLLVDAFVEAGDIPIVGRKFQCLPWVGRY